MKKIAKGLESHKYICYGLEVAPTTGNKHIQGYIQLKDRKKFTFLHEYFDLQKKGKLDKFHIEIAKGSVKKNQKYTSKTRDEDAVPNEVWLEYGTPTKQGKRTDLTDLKEKLREDPKALRELMEDDVVSTQQMRFIEGMQKYMFKHRDPKTPPKIFWLYGSTGKGKTKLVYDSFESICTVSDFKWPGNFYYQEECLLLDDFREKDIAFHTLLKILDRYPFTLAVKGSFVPLNSPFIVITSPQSIRNTFIESFEDVKQLERRITAEINLDIEEIKNLKEYIGLEDF
jgi:hypothetical protein